MLGLMLDATLDDVSCLGFSKSARSSPWHREAGRDGDDRPALTIPGWWLADDVAKDPAEGAQAGEPPIQADVRHAPVGRAQQEHGALDPPALQVAVRRLAKGGAEGADEVRFRDVGNPSQGRQVQWLGVGTVHGVARAKHPAVDLLNGAAHRRWAFVMTRVRGSRLRLRLVRPRALCLGR